MEATERLFDLGSELPRRCTCALDVLAVLGLTSTKRVAQRLELRS
jgi:hypothetical protein